jgi:hypothetical protein
MCSAIDNSASSEIHADMCFLHSKSMSDVEILRELYVVYG